VRLPDPRQGVYQRLLSALFFLTLVVVGGATILHQVGAGRWSWFDCFYMTVITLSTVGFGETLDGFADVPGARPLLLVLIVLGSGTLLYFISNFTALLVEGDLGGLLLRRRMQTRIDRLDDHILVCGMGTTGHHIVEELLAVERTFVVVDSDADRLEQYARDLGPRFLYVIGDATDDAVLQLAGVERCQGVIAALHEDKDNLFVVITARALNARARIVAKSVKATAEGKLRRAGANAVVSPNFIGGMRLVSEMIRPTAVEFLDRMLRDHNHSLRVDEAGIPEGSALAGKTLAGSGVRETGALVIAVRLPDGRYVYKPSGDLALPAGSFLIVIAQSADLDKLRRHLAAASR